MESIKFKILPDALLPHYSEQMGDLLSEFQQLAESSISVSSFSFYTSVSAVFSSKIEGEDIELDSFIKYKLSGVKFLPDYTQKIDDLYAAYEFAQNNPLSEQAIKKAHILLTTHILQKVQRGKLHTQNMFVVTNHGKIDYVAYHPAQVAEKMKMLYQDIKSLLAAELNIQEVFFFASLIHLVFVKIHPFNDGNGRTARLIEKWFVAQKLGAKAWYLQSEKYYYQQHDSYYRNIRALGVEYDLLDYSKALPFLKMLPQALSGIDT